LSAESARCQQSCYKQAGKPYRVDLIQDI
jgi:hypothetical protein